MEELKRIRAEYLSQRDLIRVVCIKVGTNNVEQILSILDKLQQERKVVDLQTRVDFLLKKSAQLKHKLKEEKNDSEYVVTKMNKSFKVIRKIDDYIGHPNNVINKAKLFDSNLVTNPISEAKIIGILVNFGQKIEEILNNMRSLFNGLSIALSQVTPLE